MTYETEAPGYTNQTNAVAGEYHVHIGGWQCYKKEKIGVTKSWILLDRKSTPDIFGESKYLTDIKSKQHKEEESYYIQIQEWRKFHSH